jgi:hypothetical protein
MVVCSADGAAGADDAPPSAPWQALYRLPLPQGQGSFRPTAKARSGPEKLVFYANRRSIPPADQRYAPIAAVR